MSHRVNHWHEALVEHLQNREWSDIQIINLTQKIGRSALMSCEGVLEVLEFQQEVDECIASQKEFDEVFAPPLPFDGADYRLPDAEGEGLPPGWLEQRFSEVE
jgi:hypothetical protein